MAGTVSSSFAWADFTHESSELANVVIPGYSSQTEPTTVDISQFIPTALSLGGKLPAPAGTAVSIVSGIYNVVQKFAVTKPPAPAVPSRPAVDPYDVAVADVPGSVLDRLTAMQAAFGSVADLVASDYAKLQLVGTRGPCMDGGGADCPPGWSLTQVQLAQAQAHLESALRTTLYGELMGIRYHGYRVATDGGIDSTTGDLRQFTCKYVDVAHNDVPFGLVATTGFVPYVTGWSPDHTRYGSLTIGYPAPHQDQGLDNSMIVPDQAVTDELFKPVVPDADSSPLGNWLPRFAAQNLSVSDWTPGHPGAILGDCTFEEAAP